jgi:hypothetical protein
MMKVVSYCPASLLPVLLLLGLFSSTFDRARLYARDGQYKYKHLTLLHLREFSSTKQDFSGVSIAVGPGASCCYNIRMA